MVETLLSRYPMVGDQLLHTLHRVVQVDWRHGCGWLCVVWWNTLWGSSWSKRGMAGIRWLHLRWEAVARG